MMLSFIETKEGFTLVEKFSALLASFLCPQEVKTNRNTGLLRLLACIFMAIDHAGKMLFPQYPIFRILGRLAFPMFAYGIAIGAVFTHDGKKYLSRITVLALISQPLYAIALSHENTAMYAVPFAQNPMLSVWNFYINSWKTPSILLSLCLGLAIILCLRSKNYVLALGLYILCERFAANLDYGIGGIHLMLLFYVFCRYPVLCALSTVGYMYVWALSGTGYFLLGQQFGMRVFSIPAIILCCIPLKRGFSLPKWFTYGFYPAHLAILALPVHFF